MKSPDYPPKKFEKEKSEIEKIELPEFVQYDEKTILTYEDAVFFDKTLIDKYGLTDNEASTYRQYLQNLNITPKDLIDKSILDIGSGSGDFKRALDKMGLKDVRITNLDEGTIWESGMSNTDVMGLAKELPFMDESFDITLAHCSVPVMDISRKEDFALVPKTLEEAIRVVKYGGIISIYPIGIYDKRVDTEVNARDIKMYEKVLEELNNIHMENPDFVIKITKIIWPNVEDVIFYSLEIKK